MSQINGSWQEPEQEVFPAWSEKAQISHLVCEGHQAEDKREKKKQSKAHYY